MVRPDPIVTGSIVETRLKRTVVDVSQAVGIAPSVHTDAHVSSAVKIVTSSTVETGIREAFINIFCAVGTYVQNDRHTDDCCIARARARAHTNTHSMKAEITNIYAKTNSGL